jgi:hypothetical protein
MNIGVGKTTFICTLAPRHSWIGETKIIATVIERLTKLHANVNTTLLAFFYCARNTDEKERAQPDVVLRSILKQLCCTELDVPISQDVVDAYLAKFTDAEKIGCDLLPLSLEETTNLIDGPGNGR